MTGDAHCGWNHAGVASRSHGEGYPDLHSSATSRALSLSLPSHHLCIAHWSHSVVKRIGKLNKQRNLFRTDIDRGRKLSVIYFTVFAVVDAKHAWAKETEHLFTLDRGFGIVVVQTAQWEATCTRHDSRSLSRNHPETRSRVWRIASSDWI